MLKSLYMANKSDFLILKLLKSFWKSPECYIMSSVGTLYQPDRFTMIDYCNDFLFVDNILTCV